MLWDLFQSMHAQLFSSFHQFHPRVFYWPFWTFYPSDHSHIQWLSRSESTLSSNYFQTRTGFQQLGFQYWKSNILPTENDSWLWCVQVPLCCIRKGMSQGLAMSHTARAFWEVLTASYSCRSSCTFREFWLKEFWRWNHDTEIDFGFLSWAGQEQLYPSLRSRMEILHSQSGWRSSSHSLMCCYGYSQYRYTG